MSWKQLMAFVQSLGFVTQAAHFFSALGCVALAAYFMPLWLAAVLFVAYTSFKELLFDNLWWGEGHGSPDWMDWIFNLMGVGVAVLVLLAADAHHDNPKAHSCVCGCVATGNCTCPNCNFGCGVDQP